MKKRSGYDKEVNYLKDSITLKTVLQTETDVDTRIITTF